MNGSLGGTTLPLPAPVVRSLDITEIDDGQLNLGLCTFLWEVVRTGNETADDPKFFLGTFDLNAWYQAQMPANVELEPSTQCSYFSICSLDETLFCEEHETGNLLDCCIDLNSVSRYVHIYYSYILIIGVCCILKLPIIDKVDLLREHMAYLDNLFKIAMFLVRGHTLPVG